MAQLTPETWAATLLKKLGIHQTPGAVQALVGWARAEGGHWNNDAKYNPLNTTQSSNGAKAINSVGVKSYGSLQQGLDATAKTLRNGRYDNILHALAAGSPESVAKAIGQTPWGTNAALAQKSILSTPRVAGIHALGVGGQNTSAGATNSSTATTTRTIPGVDNSAQRQQLVAAYLANTHNPDALTALAAGLLGAKDTAAQTTTSSSTTKTAAPQKAGSQSDPGLSAILGRAKAIDSQKLPYVYGGGHGPTPSKPGTPLDCSSAVSKVLGVNPRVSGQFTKWGKPGRGKGVTIYANEGHVLMEINGHFWGTSNANPRGGAGWIPRSQISPDYLKGFTARHPDGQ